MPLVVGGCRRFACVRFAVGRRFRSCERKKREGASPVEWWGIPGEEDGRRATYAMKCSVSASWAPVRWQLGPSIDRVEC
jgi:hypothetical protein